MSAQLEISPDDAPPFLLGGGEMGALMRATRWSDTPLGSPSSWPPSLRTVVRLMLNTNHPMYIWWGSELCCLYNDAYRQSIGPERHPGSLGRPAQEVWEEIWDVIHPQIEQVMSGRGPTWQIDHLVPITRHGQREDVYWTYSYSPIDEETAPNGIGGVLVVCTETTQHVQTARRLVEERDRLRASETRFRAALRAGRMGSWETDHTTKTRQWSPEGMALFGIDLPEGRGQVGGEHDEYVGSIHPDDRHLVETFREFAQHKDWFPAEYRIVRPDGTLLWLSGGGLVVARAPDGRPLRLVSIMVDATERKLTEQRLAIERERLTLALRAGQMGAYDTSMADGTIWWSPQTYTLFGVRPEHFEPTPAAVLEMIDPLDREAFQALRNEAIAERQPFVHEFRIRRPDGTRLWIGHRGRAEYDDAGRALRNFGVVMDITERKEVEERLRDADRQKDLFIAMLAHELRNPLAPIKNAAQVLRRIVKPEPKTTWCQDVIERQVDQMTRLLDDLLDVSRLSRGQLKLKPQELTLAAVIEQAVELARPLIDAAGHTLVVTLPDSPLEIRGDLTRLAQVFSNVLINAAKYTPRAGRISLTARAQGARASVTIADSGIGIAAEHLSQIFDVFQQIESTLAHSQGGQGIGLSLAKRLVELHGGTIAARSRGVGSGSEFELTIPLIASVDNAATPSTDVRASPQGSYRILVADDLQDAADSLAVLLEGMGHSVSVAYDGEQALKLAESVRPQVAVLDLGMPKLSGVEVCRAIRAQPWGRDMVLIAQTGWGQEHDRRQTTEAGFDHHTVKPIEGNTLAAMFERAA